ncbi:DUF3098 domain-containing protein [Candidatus Kapabacteria bacterium]|nr:DUF3098 domain-containing protein [Candidatus Kapabacteria bacterium]
MAKKVRKVSVTEKKNFNSSVKSKVEWSFPLTAQNFKILAVGLIVILAGYSAMYFGGKGDEYAVPDGNWNSFTAIVLGPFLLILGYCVIIPYGIYKFFGKSQEQQG